MIDGTNVGQNDISVLAETLRFLFEVLEVIENSVKDSA
jgi:hypothetical protein